MDLDEIPDNFELCLFSIQPYDAGAYLGSGNRFASGQERPLVDSEEEWPPTAAERRGGAVAGRAAEGFPTRGGAGQTECRAVHT